MKLKTTLTALALGLASAGAFAQVVGVSWSNFQEERWKTDEKAIKDQLAKLGASYVSADAGGSPEKQLSDVDSLIAKGARC
jgi:D-xylose transport system substrate-binding protein